MKSLALSFCNAEPIHECALIEPFRPPVHFQGPPWCAFSLQVRSTTTQERGLNQLSRTKLLSCCRERRCCRKFFRSACRDPCARTRSNRLLAIVARSQQMQHPRPSLPEAQRLLNSSLLSRRFSPRISERLFCPLRLLSGLELCSGGSISESGIALICFLWFLTDYLRRLAPDPAAPVFQSPQAGKPLGFGHSFACQELVPESLMSPPLQSGLHSLSRCVARLSAAC